MTQPSFIRAGVIGYPVRHSKSPLIHNYWIGQYGLTGEYKAIEIEPPFLKEGIKKLIDEGYAGFNVTIPHKQEIFKLCDTVDETAKIIGAVNTVVIKNGKLHGTNTDAFGFIENIRQTLPGFDFTAGAAIVLGGGGAARAIVHGLLEASVPEIIITNRTPEKAHEIATMNKTRIRVAPWENRNAVMEEAYIAVNTTSLGMAGKDVLDINFTSLPSYALVTDIVYAPLITDFLQQAQNRGNPIVAGIGMLLHQARPAFERWFGVLPDVTPDLEGLVLS